MNKIAITGSIGSGKSTALNYFKKAGYFTLSSDAVIKEIYNNDESRVALLKRLGIKSKDYKKEIIEKLKSPIFNYKLKRAIYPLMNRLRLKKIPSFNSKKKTIFEIPLLYEEKLEKNYDIVIFIKSNYKIRLKRVLDKGISKEYFKTMDGYQYTDAIKENLSSITIFNNGSKYDFYNSLVKCEKSL